MPNKDRNKRSVRQARQRERAERDAVVAASEAKTQAGGKKAAASSSSKKTPVKVAEKKGIIARTRGYFSDVRGEMHRVTWPSRGELSNYSVAVIAMLVVFGVAVWLVDTAFVAGLVGFTGLRG